MMQSNRQASRRLGQSAAQKQQDADIRVGCCPTRRWFQMLDLENFYRYKPLVTGVDRIGSETRADRIKLADHATSH